MDIGYVSTNIIKTQDKNDNRNNIFKIGCWNVRSLYQTGKLNNLLMEMNELKIDIMGISEVRWNGRGIINKNEYIIHYSCGEKHINEVALIFRSNMQSAIIGVSYESDRIIMAKIKTTPI